MPGAVNSSLLTSSLESCSIRPYIYLPETLTDLSQYTLNGHKLRFLFTAETQRKRGKKLRSLKFFSASLRLCGEYK